MAIVILHPRLQNHKKGILTTESQVVKEALRYLCQNLRGVALEDLEENIGNHDPCLGSLEFIISKHKSHFESYEGDEGTCIHSRTDVNICEYYLKDCVDVACCGFCQNLHICQYFATGSYCCRFGDECKKSHNFRTCHNKKVLKDHGIAFLSNKELSALFRNAFPAYTVPEFCDSYRSKKGCPKVHCNFLHVCKDYVMEDYCENGRQCEFAHDVFKNKSNIKLLSRFKINTDYSSDDLIRLIKERHNGLYRSDEDVLKTDFEDTDDNGSDHFSEDSGTATELQKLPEICRDYLRQECTKVDSCDKLHCDLPYQWQYSNKVKWINFTSTMNDKLENKYCNVNFDDDSFCLRWFGVTTGYVQAYEDTKILKVRRLKMKVDSSDAYVASPWAWYWNNIQKWVEYSEESSVKNKEASTGSSVIEIKYAACQKGTGSSKVGFQAGRHQYTLDFDRMCQKNDHYGTERQVLRRPAKQITPDDVKRYREEKPWLQSSYPKTWNTDIITSSNYQLLDVKRFGNDEEFDQIKNMLHKTFPAAIVLKINRVQNPQCWEVFSQKHSLMNKTSPKPVQAYQLFHGTKKEQINDICRENFDFRLNGTRCGTSYGRGSYFTNNAEYCDKYVENNSNNVRKMFVARVLVGNFTAGTKDIRRPPYKDPFDKSKGMYDSCVNNVINPSIFVVFDNTQVYPEYLISYLLPSTKTQ